MISKMLKTLASCWISKSRYSRRITTLREHRPYRVTRDVTFDYWFPNSSYYSGTAVLKYRVLLCVPYSFKIVSLNLRFDTNCCSASVLWSIDSYMSVYHIANLVSLPFWKYWLATSYTLTKITDLWIYIFVVPYSPRILLIKLEIE